jgi:hypothetical protein
MGVAVSAPSTDYSSDDDAISYRKTSFTKPKNINRRMSTNYTKKSVSSTWSDENGTKWARRNKNHKLQKELEKFEVSTVPSFKRKSRRHHRISTTANATTQSLSDELYTRKSRHNYQLSNEQSSTHTQNVPFLNNLSKLNRLDKIADETQTSLSPFGHHESHPSLSPAPSTSISETSPLPSPHKSVFASPSPSLSPNQSPSASPRLSSNLNLDIVDSNEDWQSELQFHFNKLGNGRLSQSYASFSNQWAPSPTQRTRSGRKKKLASALSAATLPTSYQTKSYASYLDNFSVEHLCAIDSSLLVELWLHYDRNNDHQLEPNELKQLAKDLVNRILRNHGEAIIGKQPEMSTNELEEMVLAEKPYLLPGHRHKHRSESVRAMSIFLKKQMDINGDGKLKRKEFMRSFGKVCLYVFSDKERHKKQSAENAPAKCFCFW